MSAGRLIAILSAALFVFSGSRGQEVVRCPNHEGALSQRWLWAVGEGKRAAEAEEFWVGYCTRRLMNENSYIVSGSTHARQSEDLPSLGEIVKGTKSPQAKQRNRWDGSSKSSVVKVTKEIAILFRVKGDLSSPLSIQRIELSDLDLSCDMRSKPLVWLGNSDDDQSVRLLSGLFEQLSSSERKREVLTAIGLHQNSTLVFPFLTKILRGEEPDDVRSQAAFWIGQQEIPDVLSELINAARNDRSAEVRDRAVFAISQIPSDESTVALIDLARNGPDTKTRGKAMFWLGQKASEKAVPTLGKIIAGEDESEVQRQALFALAQIHTSDGVDRLIKIAETHPNPRIRKQAVQLLGQSEDPKALDALIKIVQK